MNFIFIIIISPALSIEGIHGYGEEIDLENIELRFPDMNNNNPQIQCPFNPEKLESFLHGLPPLDIEDHNAGINLYVVSFDDISNFFY